MVKLDKRTITMGLWFAVYLTATMLLFEKLNIIPQKIPFGIIGWTLLVEFPRIIIGWWLLKTSKLIK